MAARSRAGGGRVVGELASVVTETAPPFHFNPSPGIAGLLKTRGEFLAALAEDPSIPSIVQKLMENALSGDLSSAKYLLDQLYGPPKTSVVTEIRSPELLAAVIRVTARFLRGQEFEAWLEEVQSELAPESESTS